MRSIEKSLKYLRLEMIITNTLIAMPIMVPFFNSIGMNQFLIGISQSIFTIVLFLVNIPTGWIADKFSRRLSNAIGVLMCALILIMYAFVDSFAGVVVMEILFGIAIAFCHGADTGLLRAYSQRKDPSGKVFLKENASIAFWGSISQVLGVTLGGVVGAYSLRLAIAVSSIPFFVGFVLSLLIKDEGEKLVSKHKNPFRDIVHFTHITMNGNKTLRWRILSYVVGNKITHVLIWSLTPLMLFAKVPAVIIGIGWAINSVGAATGAHIASKYAHRFTNWQKFLIPTATVIGALTIMSLNLSLWTIWIYVLIGLAQGWVAATLLPSVQEVAPESQQSIVVSVAGTIAQIAYALLLPIVCYFGNIDIRLAMVSTIIIFMPMVIISVIKLYNLERT